MTYVNSSATVARGVTVKINGVAIAEILDEGIPKPQTTTEDIEVTNQDSGDWKEYKAGRKDGGETEIKGHAVPSDQGQIDLAAAAAAGSTCLFRTDFPSGAYSSFYGTVKTFDTYAEGQILVFSSKVKISGAPTFSTSLSALTTPFFSAANSTSVFPTAAGTEGTYVINFANGTSSTKITPTATAGVIQVDGVTVASGAESASIALTAGAIVESTVTIQETGKAPGVYKLLLCRAA